MAEGKMRLPQFPIKVWWTLRKKFQGRLPTVVDNSYLASMLDLTQGSAGVYVGHMRAVGLIDEAGKPTKLANDWRLDESYKKACKTIISEIVPEGLMNVSPPDSPSKSAAESWLMRDWGIGKGTAIKIARFYFLLCDGDPTKEEQMGPRATTSTTSTSTANSKKAKSKDKPEKAKSKGKSEVDPATKTARVSVDGPSVNIKIDVNISPDATTEQIEAVFKSMARHFNSGDGEK